jgi:hypothetical protein
MKKIFTLLLALGSLTAVFAQRDHTDPSNPYGHDKTVLASTSFPEKYDFNRRNAGNTYFSDQRAKDEQIKQVNYEFDRKVTAVKFDRHLRFNEKNRQIHLLEMQRSERIQQVMDHFRNDHFDNRYHNSAGWKH